MQPRNKPLERLLGKQEYGGHRCAIDYIKVMDVEGELNGDLSSPLHDREDTEQIEGILAYIWRVKDTASGVVTEMYVNFTYYYPRGMICGYKKIEAERFWARNQGMLRERREDNALATSTFSQEVIHKSRFNGLQPAIRQLEEFLNSDSFRLAWKSVENYSFQENSEEEEDTFDFAPPLLGSIEAYEAYEASVKNKKNASRSSGKKYSSKFFVTAACGTAGGFIAHAAAVPAAWFIPGWALGILAGFAVACLLFLIYHTCCSDKPIKKSGSPDFPCVSPRSR
ncbi:MAG: hypothetical protein K0S27_1102 [Gammaproteobacteria bacterium]|jgi:hypothetical protein|nr:hypothetical protein [Gammaproteobacteria bacterium]